MATRKADDLNPQALFSSDLTSELATMQRIAMALGDLRDDQARERVLRWAMERFLPALAAQSGPVASVPSQHSPPAPTAACDDNDATLAVDGIDELFEEAKSADPNARRRQPSANEPVESMVKSFVADFQKLARDWNGV